MRCSGPGSCRPRLLRRAATLLCITRVPPPTASSRIRCRRRLLRLRLRLRWNDRTRCRDSGDHRWHCALKNFTAELIAQTVRQWPERECALFALDGTFDQRVHTPFDGFFPRLAGLLLDSDQTDHLG